MSRNVSELPLSPKKVMYPVSLVRVHPVLKNGMYRPEVDYRFEENYLTSFVKVPLRISYFLCLSPFHLRLADASIAGNLRKEFKINSWIPQRIVCGILTLLSVLWMVGSVRKSVLKDQKNPA